MLIDVARRREGTWPEVYKHERALNTRMVADLEVGMYVISIFTSLTLNRFW